MSEIVGIGIDLTQHVPLVSVALCREAVRANGTVNSALLARHWPPKVELRGAFRPQPPIALLPLMAGEPLLVGDAAAAHRRSAGLQWPPEAQAPYADEPACGVGRIPLVAAWTALVPRSGEEEAMARRDDPEFEWYPDSREHAASAGQILAASVKAFLNKARLLPVKSHLIAIVIPDALDEAGQQILLDCLAQTGLATDNVHLLPRPLAVAVHWCNTAAQAPETQGADDAQGKTIGRVRILTTALDVWEALSLELRARRHEGRMWLVPVRDRGRLAGALPELQTLGVSIALALARADANGERLGWWPRVFASTWLAERLAANRDLSPQELQTIREMRSSNLPESLRDELAQLKTLQPLWSRLFHGGPAVRDATGQRWGDQERRLTTSTLPCTAVLVDGAFAGLWMERGSTLEQLAGLGDTHRNPGQPAAVFGAAMAATAVAHGLPCYRETLLPLDIALRTTDAFGDPYIEWKPLVLAESIEAGRTWKPSTEVTGLSIAEGQRSVVLPIRRPRFGSPTTDPPRNKFDFRSVATEMTKKAPRAEPVSVRVDVRPGQGFARAWVRSKSPGVFEARLDWKTMASCQEPSRGELAWPPGVCVVQPDKFLFENAQDLMKQALSSLETNQVQPIAEVLGELINHLRQWQLVYLLARRRHQAVAENNQLYAGVIGSGGDLNRLSAPGLARALRQALGDQFSKELRKPEHLRNVRLQDRLLKSGGWFYTAIPEVCLRHLRLRLREYLDGGPHLKAVELVAIGLSFESPDDIGLFFKAFLEFAGDQRVRPNPWLQALRNIVRFRNHALTPEVIDAGALTSIVKQVLTIGRREVSRGNFAKIFANCLETIPFLLKRRRYEQEFLEPTSALALELRRVLQKLDEDYAHQLPVRLREVPAIAVKFIERKATEAHLEKLLRATAEEQADDEENANH